MTKSVSLTIGVFSPQFQGPFHGELTNQLRQLCALKGYRFVGIATGSLGEYTSQINLNHLDGAIIIRNAISPKLASYLVELKIPTVSIAYDYFPLSIPLVCSDHKEGCRLAYEYLKSMGHNTIAFIGDLSNYDIRKRYEGLCEILEENGIEPSEDMLYNVDSADIQSGKEACEEFFNRSWNATGIICASGLTGLGFHQCIKTHNEVQLSHLGVVIFDSIPMTPVISPEIASIDQNVLLMAHQSINLIQSLNANTPTVRLHQITPKLIKPISDAETTEDSYLATCVELQSLYNANYMKSLLSNFYEWTNDIVESNLDKVMTISPLFSNFISLVIFSRIKTSKTTKHFLLSKKYTAEKIETFSIMEDANRCIDKDYPDAFLTPEDATNNKQYFHFPIDIKGRPWGMMTVVGKNNPSSAIPSNFFSFINYMETIATRLSDRFEILYTRKTPTPVTNSVDDHEKALWHSATFEFDNTSSTTTWTPESLEIMGIQSSFEQNIYKHMDIAEMFDENDSIEIRRKFLNLFLHNKNFHFKGHMKLKSGKVSPCVIESLPQTTTESCRTFKIHIKD